jgi:AMMECR1 domain-containing protein
LSFELNLEEGKFLIQLARNAVKQYLETRKTIKPSFKAKLGALPVFVTINTLNEENNSRVHQYLSPQTLGGSHRFR